jgi:tRNA pseudouridine38-40 synthase
VKSLRLTLEYDGTDFVGWQFQKNGRSVQQAVEVALHEITQEDIRVVGGGRTDAGVHARGQVASFRMEKEVESSLLVRSLNGVLPDDVVVLSAQEVPPDFNARFNARKRRYQYYICRRPTALQRKYSWWLNYQFDLAAMQECASQTIGEHDFASFCKSESEVEHHRCAVLVARWITEDPMIRFEITANRFLHGMVRALVGTMVEVGRGFRKAEEFQKILEATDRRKAGEAAPAQGLFLEEIIYADETT